jgi:hypothetical protein
MDKEGVWGIVKGHLKKGHSNQATWKSREMQKVLRLPNVGWDMSSFDTHDDGQIG